MLCSAQKAGCLPLFPPRPLLQPFSLLLSFSDIAHYISGFVWLNTHTLTDTWLIGLYSSCGVVTQEGGGQRFDRRQRAVSEQTGAEMHGSVIAMKG